jgi:hypothetical protein
MPSGELKCNCNQATCFVCRRRSRLRTFRIRHGLSRLKPNDLSGIPEPLVKRSLEQKMIEYFKRKGWDD